MITRVFVLASTIVAVSAAPAFAQAGKVTAGANLGITMPLSSELKDDTDSSRSLAGHVTVGIARALAVRGEIGRSTFGPGGDTGDFCRELDVNCDVWLDHFGFALQWGGFGDQGALGMSNVRVMPYGFIGLASYKPGTDGETDEERRWGINGGFGLNFKITDNVGIQGDLHIHTVKPGDEEGVERLIWAVPSIGVWVGF